MQNLGSFLENPQFDHTTCQKAAEIFGDALRYKSTKNLPLKTNTKHPGVLALIKSARDSNDFTEEDIKKFEDRLTILLIKTIPYERKIVKFYDLPDIVKEAADFTGFELTPFQVPTHFQLNINHATIHLLPVGESSATLKVQSTFDLLSKEWL